MSRVVLDTNIYISASMFGGVPGNLLELALLGALALIISPALLDELDDKLQNKFGVSSQDAAILRAALQNIALVVEPRETISAIADDPDDNRVLECAVGGNADLIVSGDRHLLKLLSFRGIPIVTARQFMDSAEFTEPD
jgi:putative PIN family toxin of toxin-antitoxin system